MKRELNLRDLGGIPFSNGKGKMPDGLYLRSAKVTVTVAAATGIGLCHFAIGADAGVPVVANVGINPNLKGDFP